MTTQMTKVWFEDEKLITEQIPQYQIYQPPTDPKITFHPGDSRVEVMRIDRRGVHVNPEFTTDEATQHVLNALSAHIEGLVAAEREACAQVAESYEPRCDTCPSGVANAIRARGNK